MLEGKCCVSLQYQPSPLREDNVGEIHSTWIFRISNTTDPPKRELGICKNRSGAPEIAQEIKMSGMSNMSNRVIVETKCTFCGKEIIGTPLEYNVTNADKMSQSIAFQCKHCDTIVCKQCKGKQVKWSMWTGFSKTECPRCGKIFGPGVMFEGLSLKDISREKEERIERISQAELGVFIAFLWSVI